MRNFLQKTLVTLVAAGAVMLSAPRAAHASFFFDHNYPDVKWKTFETEHFVFHYYETTSKDHPGSTAFTARRAAKYGEIMYPKVCEQFNHFLKEKVHVVVRDQEEYSNGFAVYSEDWVTIWATPLYYRLRGRMDWVPDVFTHEFSHIVSLKSNEPRGIGMSLAADTGGLEEDGRNKVYYGASIPLGDSNEAPFWWTEGGAEYYTHNVGYNHWGTSRDMLLRMSILDPDATLTLDQLGVRGDKTGLDGERGYNHGYSIGLYLAEKYGQETYKKFADASQNKTRLEWENVIKDVLGITPKQMWEGWVQWNRDKYGKVKEDLEKQGLHEGTEVAWTEPVWLSKDEKKSADWSKMDKRKRRWTREKNGIYNYYPHVSPDGSAFGFEDSRRGLLKLTFVSPDELPAFTGKWLDPDAADDKGSGGGGAEPKPETPTPPTPAGMAGDDAGAAPLSDKDKLDRIPTISIGRVEDSDWSWSPDGNQIVAAAATVTSCLPHFYGSGYEWNDLVVLDLTKIRELAKSKAEGGYKKDLDLSCGDYGRIAHKITHELRATQPNWSPDGQWISFLKYGDGTYNVGKVKPDGTELTYLTKFADGTQIGEPRWSPDSKKLVFYLFRNTDEQQDIWEMNADGTDLHPLTWDKAEDKDAVYSPDGKSILYASDRSGIFNVYEMEIATHKVTQITNVIGGAFSPSLTKDGNLLYIGFNAYGFQDYALAKKDFYGQKVDADYKIPAPSKVAEDLASSEELPPIPSPQKRYSSIKNLEPPTVVPIVRYLDNNVQGGGELIWWDYTGKNALIADLLLGQNQDYVVRYFNDMWTPTFAIIWARFNRSREVGFEYNTNQFGELKLRQQVDFYLATMDWKLGPRHDLSLNSQMRSFDVVQGSQGKNPQTDGPWSFGKHGISSTATVGGNLQYYTVNPNIPRGSFDVNPRGAREVNVSYDVGFTKLAQAGGQIDDGKRLTQYPFQQIQANYVEYIALPWWSYLEHTLQLTLEAGYTDRNVQFNDEFFAGGQHPYGSFSRINVNTEFSGFEPFSIIGETMLISSASYRMPLYRDFDKKVGPVYFDSVYLQFFGTAGNLWSFRPTAVGGQIVTGENTGNTREMPFVGLFDKTQSAKLEQGYQGIPIEGVGGYYGKHAPGAYEKAFPVAYKNGNRLLTDIGAEVRVRSYIYNYNNWFSFFRLAYGFQKTSGIGDVNGDNVYRNIPPNSDPVTEVERSGFRYYIGLGTGW